MYFTKVLTVPLEAMSLRHQSNMGDHNHDRRCIYVPRRNEIELEHKYMSQYLDHFQGYLKSRLVKSLCSSSSSSLLLATMVPEALLDLGRRTQRVLETPQDFQTSPFSKVAT